MSHQGEILQEAIKHSGISITRIVEDLGITRPTIYRKFKEEMLDYSFVKKVGDIIGHDFSQDFTSLQPSVSSSSVTALSHVAGITPEKHVTSKSPVTSNVEPDSLKQLMQLQQKYIALLEAYNELLLKVYGPK